MLKKLIKYLTDLRKEANKWERTDINGLEDISFNAKWFLKFLFLIISVLFLYILNDGFPHFFVDFASKTLAIIVGLFMTAVIFSFNKFYEPIKKENIEIASAVEKLNDTNDFNYSKQFAYITSYNVVLCLFVLAALSLNTLFENSMNVNFEKFHFDFKNISIKSILLFLKLVLIGLQRIIVLYLMLRILFSTLYSISSMVNFMTTKLNRFK